MATINQTNKRRIALFDNNDIIIFHCYIVEDLEDYWLERLVLEAKDKFSLYQHLEFNEYAHLGTRVVSKVEKPTNGNFTWDQDTFKWVKINAE